LRQLPHTQSVCGNTRGVVELKYSLRHTHTSLLSEAGVSLEQIMDSLGHTDDQITLEMKKEASDKFAQLKRSLRINTFMLAKC
jgi:integrase